MKSKNGLKDHKEPPTPTPKLIIFDEVLPQLSAEQIVYILQCLKGQTDECKRNTKNVS